MEIKLQLKLTIDGKKVAPETIADNIALLLTHCSFDRWRVAHARIKYATKSHYSKDEIIRIAPDYEK